LKNQLTQLTERNVTMTQRMSKTIFAAFSLLAVAACGTGSNQGSRESRILSENNRPKLIGEAHDIGKAQFLNNSCVSIPESAVEVIPIPETRSA